MVCVLFAISVQQVYFQPVEEHICPLPAISASSKLAGSSLQLQPQTEGWTDGWMDGWTDGQMGGLGD